MAYLLPVDSIFATNTTNAVANTPTTTILLASVAGFSYKILGYRFWARRDATGVFDFTLQDGAAFVVGGSGLSATERASDTLIPEPGIIITSGSSFRVIDTCTIATQVYRMIVYYQQVLTT